MYIHPQCQFFGHTAYKQIYVYVYTAYTLIYVYYACIDICIPTQNADSLVILHINRYTYTVTHSYMHTTRAQIYAYPPTMPILWLYCMCIDISIRLYCIHIDKCKLHVHRYIYSHPRCRFFNYTAYTQLNIHGCT